MIARLLPLFVLLTLGIDVASGQALGRVEERTTSLSTYYVFTRVGEATVAVSVRGAVRFPGIYEVSAGTDVGTLLDLSGGGALPARVSGRRRTVDIRLFRETGAARQVVYAASFEELTTASGALPVLEDGDTLLVEIEERQRFSWRDGLNILTAAAAIALAVDRLAGNP